MGNNRVAEILLRFNERSQLHSLVASDVVDAVTTLVSDLADTTLVRSEQLPWGKTQDQPDFAAWIWLIISDDEEPGDLITLRQIIQYDVMEKMAEFAEDDEKVGCTVFVLEGESSIRNGTKPRK